MNLFGQVLGPKYDGKYLRSLINELLGDLTLKQTLTHVVIPAFDIKRLQPVIFTTIDVCNLLFNYLMIIHSICLIELNKFDIQAKWNELNNPRLADVCISTSAAPTFLPGHEFQTKDPKGNVRNFDMVDGGVAANNPVRFSFA